MFKNYVPSWLTVGVATVAPVAVMASHVLPPPYNLVAGAGLSFIATLYHLFVDPTAAS